MIVLRDASENGPKSSAPACYNRIWVLGSGIPMRLYTVLGAMAKIGGPKISV
jgi:hypothetical protein